MDEPKIKLFLLCGGKDCGNLFERRVSDIATCHDKETTYFSLYGRCPAPRCNHENFIRGDEFPEGLLLLSCPECGGKGPVSTFDWKREKGIFLIFGGTCGTCGKNLELNWSL